MSDLANLGYWGATGDMGKWSPLQLGPSLSFWYKPESLPGSGAISSWADSSPNNKPLTQATGGFQPTVANPLNGFNACRFDGVDDVMAAGSGVTNVQCVVVVAQYQDGATFTDFDGLVTDLTTATIIVGNSGTANFFDFGDNTLHFLNRVSSFASPMSAPGIVSAVAATNWGLTVQVGHDRNFGAQRFGKWDVWEIIGTSDPKTRQPLEAYCKGKFKL
jgi:hypothetical protein